MAKPAQVKKLEKEKLLDTQEGFVDTYNYLVDFVENLKGDGDTDKGKTITVDRSVDDHPVICCSNENATNTTVDDLSIGKVTTGTGEDEEVKLEIKGYSTAEAETDSLAKIMTLTTTTDGDVIERSGTTTAVKYRPFGRFVSGDNSNIVFTPQSDGSVKVDVYYL